MIIQTGDLSTYPGFNEPLVPVEAGAAVLANNPVTRGIRLTPDWYPKGITVPVPLRLWNARCLILNGLANADLLDNDFKEKGRQVQRVNEKLGSVDKSENAWVQLYGSDYTATTLGPFKAVFTLASVKGDAPGPYFMWRGPYFGTSLVNKHFKEKVWGVVPNHLAAVETAYAGKRKAVRLLEGDRVALRMIWNSARIPDLVQIPSHLVFKTVAPGRTTDDGVNDVEMDAIVLKSESSDSPTFPFDQSNGDEYAPDKNSLLGRDLERIGFRPVSWQCMMNYGGVVKIYDENGRNSNRR